jgi:hypothetical protein
MVTNGFNPSVRSKITRLGKVYVLPSYMVAKIWRRPDYRKDILYSCNISVLSLASLTEEQAKRVISVAKVKPLTKYPTSGCESYFSMRKVIGAFDYPLKRKCVLTIKPTLDFNGDPMCMSIGFFLWQIAKAYQDVLYVNPPKYGIWGHGLSDLYFENIILKKISPTKYYGIVEFGS